jgi:two-component system response regulator YesN
MTENGRSYGFPLFTSGPQLAYLLVNRPCGQAQAERLIEEVRKWVKISISVGVSEETRDFENLPILYGHAGEALQNKWIYGDGLVCKYEDMTIDNQESTDYPSDIDEAIVRSIRGGDTEKALKELTAFMDTVTKGNVPFRLFRRLGLQLLSSVYRIVFENKIQDRIAGGADQPHELFHRNFTAEEYVRYMSSLIDSITSSLEWNRQQKHNRTLDKAIEFIRMNYAKDLSLEDVAGHAQMSGNYFSSFFKQETGETFIEYLTRFRMEKAKSLMMNADLRLYEICQLVGYQDVKYFSRLFKRNVGVTPAEYRQFFYRKED